MKAIVNEILRKVKREGDAGFSTVYYDISKLEPPLADKIVKTLKLHYDLDASLHRSAIKIVLSKSPSLSLPYFYNVDIKLIIAAAVASLTIITAVIYKLSHIL